MLQPRRPQEVLFDVPHRLAVRGPGVLPPQHVEATVDHRLEVHKAGPGRYLVGFRYESAAERETVLLAMAQMMGTSR